MKNWKVLWDENTKAKYEGLKLLGAKYVNCGRLGLKDSMTEINCIIMICKSMYHLGGMENFCIFPIRIV